MENRDNTQIIREAIKIAKNGDKVLARQMITEIVDLEPENEQALLAYAFIAPNTLEAEQVLEEVLRINPNNATALKQLAKLREFKQQSGDALPVQASESTSPFTEAPNHTDNFTQAYDFGSPSNEAFKTTTSFDPSEVNPTTQFSSFEPKKVSCKQCGKMIDAGFTYCEECQQEIEQKKHKLAASPVYPTNQKDLEKKIDKLIQIQLDQKDQLKSINRAAQLYFWVTIIGFVLSIGYLCFLIFGLSSLISGTSNIPFPTQ